MHRTMLHKIEANNYRIIFQENPELIDLYNAFMYYGNALNRAFAANISYRDGTTMANLMQCQPFEGNF